jgi:hypothetical protein
MKVNVVGGGGSDDEINKLNMTHLKSKQFMMLQIACR